MRLNTELGLIAAEVREQKGSGITDTIWPTTCLLFPFYEGEGVCLVSFYAISLLCNPVPGTWFEFIKELLNK